MTSLDTRGRIEGWSEGESLHNLFREALEATLATKEQGDLTEEEMDAVARHMAAAMIARHLDLILSDVFFSRTAASLERASQRFLGRGRRQHHGRITLVR